MTSQQLSFAKHAVIEFGAYIQTHEEHTNDMDQRTMGCICLGPTGNRQGVHWFMSLSSGERVVRYRWTELPMPRETIYCVSSIGRRQGMPTTITYANRHGLEIGDTINDFDGDSSDGDSSYVTTDSDDDSLLSSSDDDSTEDGDSDSDGNNDDGGDFDSGHHHLPQPRQHDGQGVANHGPTDDDDQGHGDQDNHGDDNGSDDDDPPCDDVVEHESIGQA
jgi:hypothetical protein